MRNKRAFLARIFGRLGALGLLERLTDAMRPGLVVLTYHRIAEPGGDPFYDPVISATPESFRAQVEWLRRRLRIVSLPELIARIESGSRWREPAAVVTFDDGYRDNFEVAVPILRECDVPATFFLPTAFLEAPRLPWWDQVAYVLKRTRVKRLLLDHSSPPISIDLERTPRSDAIMTVIRAILDGTIADEPEFLARLAAQAEVAVDDDDDALARALFTSWDQVRQILATAPELTIGAHGHTHRKLAGLDGEAQRIELTESRQILESRLGRAVEAMAYPYGWPGTYTAESKALAARAGYRLAFASREGVNRPESLDRFDIRRFGIGSGDSPALLRARTALHAAFGGSFL
jgi:peptidoglycan/xylan/chitin deacetylase (PgdA/CDA1 family)